MSELKSSSQIMFINGITYNDNPGDWIDRSKTMIPLNELLDILQELEDRINNCDDNNFKDGLCEAFDIVYNKIEGLTNELKF